MGSRKGLKRNRQTPVASEFDQPEFVDLDD